MINLNIFEKFSRNNNLEKVSNTAEKVSVFGFILVRNFPYLNWIPRDTPYLSAFSPNAGKYTPE